MRFWSAIWVENNCDVRGPLPNCAGSDRITLSTSLSSPLDCNIASQPTATSVELSNTSPSCCPATPTNNGLTGQQMMLVLNNAYSQVYATAFDPATCILTYAAGQATGNDAPLGVTDWTSGSISVVTVATYYYDSVAHQIKVFSDLNNNGAMDASEVTVLAANVFDLQAALGFDISGANNLYDDGSTTDSWLYNNGGDVASGSFLGMPMSALKMVEVGVISGTQANYQTKPALSPVQLLDGPERQAAVLGQFDLRAVKVKVTPRNSVVFE